MRIKHRTKHCPKHCPKHRPKHESSLLYSSRFASIIVSYTESRICGPLSGLHGALRHPHDMYAGTAPCSPDETAMTGCLPTEHPSRASTAILAGSSTHPACRVESGVEFADRRRPGNVNKSGASPLHLFTSSSSSLHLPRVPFCSSSFLFVSFRLSFACYRYMA